MPCVASNLNAVRTVLSEDRSVRERIKWSRPREIEFRRELPKTRIGKIDYKVLVAEHIERAAE